jgi:pseudouridine-5'-phosphate glycosidase
MMIHPEVAEALAARRPVVALESTIVTHGMPYPANVETARAVEATVRANGAVPATIAVLKGVPTIGLQPADLERFGTATEVMKLSRADLAYAIAMGRDGSTTVAATMILAHRAGIGIFATGGMGGVHRGAETSFDISADLTELARTPVVVVSAGAKAILDLPKTLEILETLGVPVIGYQTAEYPAFFSRDSGLKAPLRLDTPAEIARFLKVRADLGLSQGVVIANPIPKASEIERSVIEPVIMDALQAASAAGISGKAVTPYLLNAVLERTQGQSLQANVALILNNAAVAAEIAVAVAGQTA